MKTVNSLALASLSWVAVSGTAADEPLKALPQQQNQVASPSPKQSSVLSNHAQRRTFTSRRDRVILQSPSTQPQSSASAATSPPEKLITQPQATAANALPVNQAPRRSLLSRLLRSRTRNAIPISQATAPASSSNIAQPLPNAK